MDACRLNIDRDSGLNKTDIFLQKHVSVVFHKSVEESIIENITDY